MSAVVFSNISFQLQAEGKEEFARPITSYTHIYIKGMVRDYQYQLKCVL
jgi:hypothetical protein